MMGKGARAVQEEQHNWEPPLKEVSMVRRIEPEPMEYEDEIEVVKWLWRNKPQEIVDRAKEEGISPQDMAEEMTEDLIMEGKMWKKKERRHYEEDEEVCRTVEEEWRKHRCEVIWEAMQEEEALQEEEWEEVVTKIIAKRRRYEANKVTRRGGTKKEKEVPKEKVNYFWTVEQEGIIQVQGE